MLKLFYCQECNRCVVANPDVQNEDKWLCDSVEDVSEIGEAVYCGGKLIEFQQSIFPENKEMIRMVANLTADLALSRLDVHQLTLEKNSYQDTLRQTNEELRLAKSYVQNLQRRETTLSVIEQNHLATIQALKGELAKYVDPDGKPKQ